MYTYIIPMKLVIKSARCCSAASPGLPTSGPSLAMFCQIAVWAAVATCFGHRAHHAPLKNGAFVGKTSRTPSKSDANLLVVPKKIPRRIAATWGTFNDTILDAAQAMAVQLRAETGWGATQVSNHPSRPFVLNTPKNLGLGGVYWGDGIVWGFSITIISGERYLDDVLLINGIELEYKWDVETNKTTVGNIWMCLNMGYSPISVKYHDHPLDLGGTPFSDLAHLFWASSIDLHASLTFFVCMAGMCIQMHHHPPE